MFRKERKSIYIALFGQGGTLKALRHGSHSFTCKSHHACLRERSLDVTTTATEAADIQLQLHYSKDRPRKDERLSWPSWLTYSGWFTHQMQVERRTAKARRPKTDVLPLDHATNQSADTTHAGGRSLLRSLHRPRPRRCETERVRIIEAGFYRQVAVPGARPAVS